MAKRENPVTYPIPPDWRSYPELAPALRILVEGARRVVLASRRDSGTS
ncbi:MAG TPA: hypothetical protein VNT75_12740 [Symbiobacteriaceae bacterium]|nr:hypothetical protein [Symbiobacteriaceae bacterium]